MTEPEVSDKAEFLLNAEPFTREGADHDGQQAGEEEVDAEALALWFITGNGRRHEQTGRQPGGRNPEDA